MIHNPGRFDTPCQFFAQVYTTNDYGEPVYEWDNPLDAPRWCKVEPLKGVERVTAQQTYTEIPCKVVIRRWDVHLTDEIEFRGERWQITGIEDYGRQGIMVLWVVQKS